MAGTRSARPDFRLHGLVRDPLGVATSMFCAITLGIGVDYGIHLLERVRRAAGLPDRVTRAIEEAGPAIVADAIAIALGFGLLVVPQVPANARLGVLVAAALLAAAVLTLVGLASLLSSTFPQSAREPHKGTADPSG